MRRESSISFDSRSHSSRPFRGEEPSGDTPGWVDDDPFEGVVVESISVGSVPVHTPQLTDPIAPFAGFSMQAEVVKSTSKYTEFRKAQKKTFLDKGSKAEEAEGGLFFASRERGRTLQVRIVGIIRLLFFIECFRCQLDISSQEQFSESDEGPSQQPPVDYLKVEIPDISIVLTDAESDP